MLKIKILESQIILKSLGARKPIVETVLMFVWYLKCLVHNCTCNFEIIQYRAIHSTVESHYLEVHRTITKFQVIQIST